MTLIILQIITLLLLGFSGFCLYLLIRSRQKGPIDLHSIIQSPIKKDEEIDLLALDPNPVMRISKQGELIYANVAARPILQYWGVGINDKIPAQWREVFHQLELAEEYKSTELTFSDLAYQLKLIVGPDKTMCVFGTEISKYKNREEEFTKKATIDEITKLPNRVIFDQTLRVEINYARAEKQKIALIIFRIEENLDMILTHGQTEVNLLMAILAARIREFCEEDSLVARLGENEFAIISSTADSPATVAGFVQELIVACKGPYQLNNKDIFVTLNVGIAFYPADGETPETLLRNAELALSRTSGAVQYEFYQRGMVEQLQIKRNMIADLHKAIDENQLSLHYQPQVHLLTSTMVSCEALIRWNHPEQGYISPFFFMTAAEATPLIHVLGEWVLREACRQLSEWMKKGYPKIKVGINVSAKQLFAENFVELVAKVIKEYDIPPTQIELELTESALAQNIEQASRVLKGLKALQVHLALDDFGTGYSSLSYLMEFPIDKLKIDRSFIKNLETDRKSMLLTKGIIDLGHSINMRVIAEGVETKGQLNFLKLNRCDLIQGYYFSKPLPKEEFEEVFKKIWKV